ncbi:MAG TPA: 4-alpha-glucanotransferase [Syntrophales bacterium]|nr:4-alpha-glucanotransferase [Syntrophales bacterium]
MKIRGSGILLHITSLPSPYGIGDLGPSAYRFADFLAEAKQRYWQILPLNATGSGGLSPYHSISAFAGNIYFISPEVLVADGYLNEDDLEPRPRFPGKKISHAAVCRYKERLFQIAYDRFRRRSRRKKQAFQNFADENSSWLDDFALFKVLKSHFALKPWCEWPEGIRKRKPRAITPLKWKLAKTIEMEKFLQYIFFRQWSSLHSYCRSKGIQIIGDMPIYLNLESADLWSHPDIFKLDASGRPEAVAGVPPDYFSTTGQLWGNPVYRWDVLKERGYDWLIARVAHLLGLVDHLRIDHFRGLVAFWEVPIGEKSAINGRWIEAPAVDFLHCLIKKIPCLSLIAEDLGIITADVREVMSLFGLTGMKVLQFAFGEDLPTNPYAPHNIIQNSIVYTGTHDNNTIKGWFDSELGRKERARLFRYLGRHVTHDQVSWELIRLAMASVADTAIIPLQDILGLGGEARMNRPATARGNWQWRMLPGQLKPEITKRLRDITEIYGRA